MYHSTYGGVPVKYALDDSSTVLAFKGEIVRLTQKHSRIEVTTKM